MFLRFTQTVLIVVTVVQTVVMMVREKELQEEQWVRETGFPEQFAVSRSIAASSTSVQLLELKVSTFRRPLAGSPVPGGKLERPGGSFTASEGARIGTPTTLQEEDLILHARRERVQRFPRAH